MYVIKNKKTLFKLYVNAKEAAAFIAKNGSKNYTVKQIKEFDLENFFYMCLGFLMIFVLTALFIYYSI